MNSILLEQNSYKGCGGHRDQGTHDSCQGSSAEQGDQDRKSREFDAAPHDAWDEVGILDIDIENIKDQHAETLGPGIERGHDCGEGNRDYSARDGDDIEQSHQESEQEEVADVQDREDDSGRDSQDAASGVPGR